MLKIWRLINHVIDRTTSYIVVVYSLLLLLTSTLVWRIFDQVSYSILVQLLSVILAVGTSYGLSVLISRLTKIEANHLSSAITGLIIFFLVNPAETWLDTFVLVGAVVFAIASKYVLVYRGQHIFNPVAIGLFLISLTGLGSAIWWVASSVLFIPLSITGALVIIKVRRYVPVFSFVCTGFIVYLYGLWSIGGDVFQNAADFFLSYPTIFLAAFMLTEPFTMPGTKRTQIFYGVLVGFLFSTHIFKPLFTMTPELALLIGNLAVYGFSLKRKLKLRFIKVRTIAENTFEFTFEKPLGMKFIPGQYLEWMLPHTKTDIRGIRRYFTIASSPTEDTLRLALKITEPASTYKHSLKNMKAGDVVIASQLAGDFTLPIDMSKKIAMIAGGIGITPFRSQIKQMVDKNEFRDTVLFYCNNKKEEVAYSGLFAEAENKLPLQTVYVLAKEEPAPEYETGYISADIIKKHTPDFLNRIWYVSGPSVMVTATCKILRDVGVTKNNIIKDFFPGLS